MECKALILGLENIKGDGRGENPKPYDFWKVNFVDTDDPAGNPQSMTLPKEGLTDNLDQFKKHHLKLVDIVVFVNGKYQNFGGFKKAA